jgi:4-hydroxyphenylacetate 3-monooxygenase
VRSGAEFIESVRDAREVWLDGERVKDITTHPAFRNTIRSIADLYDLAHSAESRDELTTLSPYSDRRIHRAFQVAATRADLVAKRKAFKTVSEASFGFLGRSPDYMAAAAAGFAAAPQAFTGAVFCSSRCASAMTGSGSGRRCPGRSGRHGAVARSPRTSSFADRSA